MTGVTLCLSHTMNSTKIFNICLLQSYTRTQTTKPEPPSKRCSFYFFTMGDVDNYCLELRANLTSGQISLSQFKLDLEVLLPYYVCNSNDLKVDCIEQRARCNSIVMFFNQYFQPYTNQTNLFFPCNTVCDSYGLMSISSTIHKGFQCSFGSFEWITPSLSPNQRHHLRFKFSSYANDDHIQAIVMFLSTLDPQTYETIAFHLLHHYDVWLRHRTLQVNT